MNMCISFLHTSYTYIIYHVSIYIYIHTSYIIFVYLAYIIYICIYIHIMNVYYIYIYIYMYCFSQTSPIFHSQVFCPFGGVSSNEVCSGEIIAPAANRPKEGRISFHVESTCPGFFRSGFVVLRCDDLY